MPATQTKCWPFTWFPPGCVNHDAAEAKAALAIVELLRENADVKFLVAQAEKCPTSGRLHIQGYVQIENRWTFTRTKKMIFEKGGMATASLAAARGSASENEVRRYARPITG